MTPKSDLSGPSSSSAESWEVWWRGHVMRELERLDANTEALRKEFEAACRDIRKEMGGIDKTASVDIRALQVQAASWGVVGGSIISAVIGIVVYFVTRG